MGDGGFGAYRGEQQRLLDVADQVEAVWREFVATRSPQEALTGKAPIDEDMGADPVSTHLAEARARLRRTTIEVAIVGYIKRGKSTLMNALLGLEVSSMKVTPETVVPVWVEYGESPSATVTFRTAQGDLVDVDMSTEEAAAVAGQRDEEADRRGDRVPVKVTQRVPADILKAGVRFIDTPGLDDPDGARRAALEELTLSELDRVTGAIFVILSPPGVSGAETELLQQLDGRRVDKTLFVGNLYSEPWEDEETRAAVADHLTRALVGVDPATAKGRVQLVNAKRAWRARLDDDDAAYEESGVAELERELERYVTGGAMADLLRVATQHLVRAVAAAHDRIAQRRRLLADPSPLQHLRDDLEDRIAGAQRALASIARQIESDAQALGLTLGAIAAEPYDAALLDVAGVTRKEQVRYVDGTLKARIEASKSRIAVEFDRTLRELESRAKAELEAAFGDVDVDQLAEDIRLPASVGSSGGLVLSDDVSRQLGVSALAAAGGAIVGGSIAGGAGLALVALGPVGWIVGAVVGGLLAVGGAQLVQSQLGAGERQQLVMALEQQRGQARQRVVESVELAGRALSTELQRREADYSRDARDELAGIQRILSDSGSIDAQLDALSRLDDRLERLELPRS